MVRLVTEAPDPRGVQIDKLIGSFQRSEGSVLGSLAEGAATGIQTFERGLQSEQQNQQEEINDELFNLLLGTDSVTQFSNEISALDARAKQTGATTPLTQGRIRQAIRKLQSEGVPEEVIAYSFRQVTGRSPFDIIQALSPQQTDQRDLMIDFLKGQNQVMTSGGVPITELDDVELEAFTAEVQYELNQLEDSKRLYTIATNNENMGQIDARLRFQRDVLPKQMTIARRQINTWIQNNISDEMLEKITDPITGEVRSYLIPSNVSPEQLTQWMRDINALEAAYLDKAKNETLFALNSEQFDRAMATPRYFYNELRRMLNGEANLESVNAIETVAQAEANSEMFRNNPQLRPALTFLNHVSPIIANLGLEGFGIKEEITNEILIPAMNGTRVRFADLLRNKGALSIEAQDTLVSTLTAQFMDVRNDMETRGQALKLLLPSLARSGIDDPNFYRSLLPLLADENSAKLVIEAMEDPSIKSETRRNIQRGLLDYKDQFEVSLEDELMKSLNDDIFYGIIDVKDVSPGSVAAVSKFYTLGDFVTLDLNTGTIQINRDALKQAKDQGVQIGDKELAIIVNQFQNVNAQFADDLNDMMKINKNFNAAKEVLSTGDEDILESLKEQPNTP